MEFGVVKSDRVQLAVESIAMAIHHCWWTWKRLCWLVSEFGTVCERIKLRVHVGNSKVMRCKRSGAMSVISVNLNGVVLEEIECSKYLVLHAAKGVETQMRCR